MKKILLLTLLIPSLAWAQTYPSPTFNSVILQNPLTPANGGTGATSATGTGSVVLSNSPSLTTPNLGVPSAVTLTNGTGLPISTGVSGLGTGVTSALTQAVTGSGGAVLASSPAIASPTITGSLTATGLVTTSDLATQAANTVLANVTSSSASPAAFAMPNCSASSNALGYTSGTGWYCNTSINASALGGATFATPGPIGSTTASSGNFTAVKTNNYGANNSSLWVFPPDITGSVSSIYQPLYITAGYDGTESLSGFNTGISNIFQYQEYGQNNTTASGSSALVGGFVNVYNATNPSGGRTEFTPFSEAVVPQIGGNITGGQNYYNDFIMMTNTNTSSTYQEGFIAGVQNIVQKWVPGNTLDANHNGSWGMVITTNPQNAGYDSQNRSGYSTYPLNAMLQLSGWSGPNSVNNGGQNGSATAGALVGLQIGGVTGSTWSCVTCRSYIPIGIDIQDYTTEAIHIEQPHSGHGSIAIATDVGAGNLIIGDGVYSSFLQVVQPSGNANVVIGTGATGYNSTISFQDNGTEKYLLGRGSTDNFVLYDDTTGGTPFAVNSGTVSLGEGKGVQLVPTTFSTLPVCNSAFAGTTAYITDASAAITTWHQQVTAGGGSNKAYIACNGSGWYAFSY